MSTHKQCMQQIQSFIRQNQILRRQLNKTKKERQYFRQSVTNFFKKCFSNMKVTEMLENFQLDDKIIITHLQAAQTQIINKRKHILAIIVQNLEGCQGKQLINNKYKKGFTLEQLETQAINISKFIKSKITQLQEITKKTTSQIKDAYQSQIYLKKQFNDAKLKIQQLQTKISQLQIDLDTAQAQLEVQKVENNAKSRKVQQLQNSIQASVVNISPNSYAHFMNHAHQQYDSTSYQLFNNKL